MPERRVTGAVPGVAPQRVRGGERADVFADLGWVWDKPRAEGIIKELESTGAIEVAVRTSAVCSFYVCARGAELVSQDWDANHP